MQKRSHLASAAIIALAAFATLSPASAGTTGRISKFITPTTVGDSVLFENAAKIGLGTNAPMSALDIRGSYPLNLMGLRPFLTFRDTAAGGAISAIQSISGALTFVGANTYSGNPTAFFHMDRLGRVGFGTRTPQRLIQIGPGTDAMFTIEGSDASPRAGTIRFGDKTGWQLRIGRSRESSAGPLNTGLTGSLFTFRDDGAFGPTSYPLLATGVEPLCRTLANFVTRCQASSLRYKTDIEPYKRGLDVINGLRPIAFTRILGGSHDIGLAAEEVAAVEPRLTYKNDENKVEGIRYELLSTVFINAIQEQQAEINRQRKMIEELQAIVARLAETK